MEIINPKHIYLRVFDRGVGETQSCGNGACTALAVVGIKQSLLSNNVKIDFPARWGNYISLGELVLGLK